MNDVVAGLVTGPDREQLVRIGRVLVDERLIACLNVVDRVTSVYRWEGEVCEEAEALGILKTTASRSDAVERRIRELHPYAVPEVLFIPVAAGSPPYMEWVTEQVND
ncbi:divalent-cation tolerance protein CutA [Candidatus Palauibacter polyketidifaciens]|uniref:divalent-cation tolerance protein CutA n=1 Tax=Candidatus Palauibacter polyketidifaciens TaxID=3056740 RepID=UPI00139B847B|nr:divalent-cation tolerance protein CutA [Candidatus Palauibacter polyketidifaciens]MDE2719855.1 divalent-cation tolerance protein CutA [Candidatus Palauibacter polyketidifaciens]MYE35793.1 divalent-cation tolerance protein CutA [Gemmatimonadales bacterium]